MALVTFYPLLFPGVGPRHPFPPHRPGPSLSTLQSCPPSEPPAAHGSIAPSPARFLEVAPGADYWPAVTPNDGTKERSLTKSPQQMIIAQDTSGGRVSLNPSKVGIVLSIAR